MKDLNHIIQKQIKDFVQKENKLSIKHKIYNKKGELVTKELTPMKAIRLRCLWCKDYSSGDVHSCGYKHCPLWPYRMGRKPDF